MYEVIIIIFSTIVSICSIGAIILFILSKKLRKRRYQEKTWDSRRSIGIFHPFSTSGVSEERILYNAIIALHLRFPEWRYIVYTGDSRYSPEEIVGRAKSQHGIELNVPIEFIYLTKRDWIEPHNYPRFPRLGINVGSILLAIEAAFKFVPDVFFDTGGYPFTYPIFKFICGSRVSCYISPSASDIIFSSISQQRNYFGNGGKRTNKYLKLIQKVTYSKIYRMCFRWAGNCSELVIASSGWSEEWIVRNLSVDSSKIIKIYPPVPVDELSKLEYGGKELRGKPIVIQILSLSPFIPRSDHPMQIRTLFELRQLMSEEEWDKVHLVFLSQSNSKYEDERIKDMEDLCKHLSLEENVSFQINGSYEERLIQLRRSLISIHTVTSHHFPMDVVETMGAGILTVAHSSNGLIHEIGLNSGLFLGSDESEYAQFLYQIIQMERSRRESYQIRGRDSVVRFSVDQFNNYLPIAMECLMK